uniref:Protein S100 n=2 Tax=Cercopithecidae TaxID=9527 RepID=A0A8C9I0B5_9PRIM
MMLCKQQPESFLVWSDLQRSSTFSVTISHQKVEACKAKDCRTGLAKVSSPTETERCIESLIAVFQKYAGKDGYNYTLSKTEFLSFMNTELAAFTKNQKDPGVLDRMMKRLDTNSDGQLDFSEFLNLIGGLAMACHDSFLKAVPSQKRI